jgi:hypothetical protein
MSALQATNAEIRRGFSTSSGAAAGDASEADDERGHGQPESPAA